MIKTEPWKCTSPTSTVGISLRVLIPPSIQKLERSEKFPRTLQQSFVLCSEWKMQSLRANKAAAWPNVSTVRNRRTNSSLPKAGRSTTTDSSPDVTCKKAKQPTIKPQKPSKSPSINHRAVDGQVGLQLQSHPHFSASIHSMMNASRPEIHFPNYNPTLRRVTLSNRIVQQIVCDFVFLRGHDIKKNI